eukprot:g824.t1
MEEQKGDAIEVLPSGKQATKRRKSLLEALPATAFLDSKVTPMGNELSSQRGPGYISRDTRRWLKFELEGGENDELERVQAEEAAQERELMQRMRNEEANSRRKRMLYLFDNWIAHRGNQFLAIIIAAFGLLIVLCGPLWMIAMAAGGYTDYDDSTNMFIEGLWSAWSYMADPGTHADAGDIGGDSVVEYELGILRSDVNRILRALNSSTSTTGGAAAGAGATVGATAAGGAAAVVPAWSFMVPPPDPLPDPPAGDRVDHLRRAMSMVIALVGVLIFSVVIGVICQIIDSKLEALKEGKSNVVEKEHTVILGWTDKTVPLIKEICLANESEGGGVIVVLGDLPKEQLEKDFRDQMKKKEKLGTSIVFRTGNPMFASDLAKVAASTARSICILAGDGDPDEMDSRTLRVVLGLLSLQAGLSGHIVAEMRDVDNEVLVQIVGGAHTETVVSHDLVGRLMLMAARQPGLAKVYSSVLGFDGDEFYMAEWPEITGCRFGDLVVRFPDATPIGVKTIDGRILLNTVPSHVMAEGEELLVIAEDDDTYQPETPASINRGTLPEQVDGLRDVEKILLCGWRRDIREVLLLLDEMALYGSEVHMLCEVPVWQRSKKLLEEGLYVDQLKNIRIVDWYGNSAVRRQLMTLPVAKYTSCLIFADEEKETNPLNSDSHSIASLLLLRSIQRQQKDTRKKEILRFHGMADKVKSWTAGKDQSCPITCEILDSRTQKTIANNPKISESSDFLQTNTMVSRILAMVAEDRGVMKILGELLEKEGAAFMVKPSSRYARKGEITSYYALALRAQEVDEILCGYLLHGKADPAIINPKRKQEERNWGDYDMIVLAGRKIWAAEDEDEDVMSVIQKFDSHHKVGRATEMEKGTTSGAGAAAAKAKDAKTLSQEFAERVGSMERDEREKFMGLMSLMTDIAKQA